MNSSCRQCTAIQVPYLVKNRTLLVRRHGWIQPSSVLLAFQPSSSVLEAKERMLLSNGLILNRCSAASKCCSPPPRSSVADDIMWELQPVISRSPCVHTLVFVHEPPHPALHLVDQHSSL